MRLDITEGRGEVKAFTVSDGEKRETLVSDPKNDERSPVELREWIESTGGTMPLPLPGKDDDGRV